MRELGEDPSDMQNNWIEFGPNFPVVVDLSVENDRRVAIVRHDRLVARFEVENFQASGADGTGIPTNYTLLVRAPMVQSRDSAFDPLWFWTPVLMGKPGDPAQF
jgi:hypothetical protein